MKVGDLVTDEWGDIAIVLSQMTPFCLRWRIKYISHGGISTAWEEDLHPLG